MSAIFETNLALDLARWSDLAYGKLPLPEGVDCQMIDLLPKCDVQALVIREPKRLTIAHRGTDDIGGWFRDAEVKFKSLGAGIKVHTGFYDTVDAIWPYLLPFVREAVAEEIPIFDTGHSKGGGESCQFCYRLATEKGIKVSARYTFGEPKSFNHAGQQAYEKLGIPTWRVIDEEDVVCRIPLIGGFFPPELYWHVGQTAFFDAYGQMVQNEPPYAHLESDVIGIIKEALHFKAAMIDDHPCKLYIDRLRLQKLELGI